MVTEVVAAGRATRRLRDTASFPPPDPGAGGMGAQFVDTHQALALRFGTFLHGIYSILQFQKMDRLKGLNHTLISDFQREMCFPGRLKGTE